MQDVHVKLKPRLPQQEQHSTSSSFHQQIELTFKEEISEKLHVGHNFMWCWNLDTSESWSEIPVKFWNVVLEKDGEDQLDRSC